MSTYTSPGPMIRDEAERDYPPAEGGMVDTVRKQGVAEAAQLQSHHEATAAAPRKMKTTVDVVPQGVPIANGRTFVIAKNGGFEQILPANAKRYRATITAPDSAVVICFSLQQANDPVNGTAAAGVPSNGYLLGTSGSLVTHYQGTVYAVNPSGSASARVAVQWDAYPEGE